MDASANYWYESNMLAVETYNLFGERQDLPDVVHCETIETRSLLHDWEFKPHRHARLHQFLLVESGGGQAVIEDDKRTLGPRDLVNVPMGVVHGFRFLPGTQGWVVTLAAELQEQNLHDGEGLRPLLAKPAIVPFTPDIRQSVRFLFSEYATRDFARAHVLRSLSGVVTGLVARALAEAEPGQARPAHALQHRFEAMLEARYQDHLGVADYAGLLAVTPTHLSRVLRQATGLSASAAIEARVIREARRFLAFSNLQISEIAYQLGYGDPAYFSRVFARATGQSPRAFRQGLEP